MSLGSLGDLLVSVKADTSKFNNDLKGLGNTAKVLGGAIAGSFALAAAKKIAAAAVELAKVGAEAQGVEDAFDSLTSTMEGGSRRWLSALQEGSNGMVDTTTLMKNFNSAAQLIGKDFAQTLPDAMSYFTKISASTGESVNYLMDSYVRGIGRLSPMILDNLKIQATQVEATARAAEMYGVAESSLTKYQIQMGMASVVNEKLEASTSALPDVANSSTQAFAEFSASVTDLKTVIGKELAPTITAIVRALTGYIKTVSDSITVNNDAKEAYKNLKISTKEYRDMTDGMIGEIKDSRKYLDDLNETYDTQRREMIDVSNSYEDYLNKAIFANTELVKSNADAHTSQQDILDAAVSLTMELTQEEYNRIKAEQELTQQTEDLADQQEILKETLSDIKFMMQDVTGMTDDYNGSMSDLKDEEKKLTGILSGELPLWGSKYDSLNDVRDALEENKTKQEELTDKINETIGAMLYEKIAADLDRDGALALASGLGLVDDESKYLLESTGRLADLYKDQKLTADELATATGLLRDEVIKLDGSQAKVSIEYIVDIIQKTRTRVDDILKEPGFFNVNAGFSSGGSGVVPPGYPNDSYLMGLSSGEKYNIVPKGVSLATNGGSSQSNDNEMRMLMELIASQKPATAREIAMAVRDAIQAIP